MSLPSLLNPLTPQVSTFLSPSTTTKLPISLSKYLNFPLGNLHSVSPSFLSSYVTRNDDVDDEEVVIGDCVVFEDGAFEDPYLQADSCFGNPNTSTRLAQTKPMKKKKKKQSVEIEAENLVPEQWRHVQEEFNITKKDRRKMAQQLEFGSRVEKKKLGLVPLRNLNLQEYLKYKEAKLAELNPVVLDNPPCFSIKEEKSKNAEEIETNPPSSSERVAPKNPRWAVYGKGFEDVVEFFNSEKYQPGEKKSEGPRKLFTKEEKLMLNRRVPDLATATSGKWLPLHTLSASGEFYLVDALLKHNIDINAVDKNGLTAIHKAIIGKKQAITNYLLRESANPFIRDEDGATLMHYAVSAASTPTIKLLLLYGVDINLQDNDGWTLLHLAVLARRTDIMKLLLIRGADPKLKNKDGLTPLDLCLYSGRDTRTYELIKLLKQPWKPRSVAALRKNQG